MNLRLRNWILIFCHEIKKIFSADLILLLDTYIDTCFQCLRHDDFFLILGSDFFVLNTIFMQLLNDYY